MPVMQRNFPLCRRQFKRYGQHCMASTTVAARDRTIVAAHSTTSATLPCVSCVRMTPSCEALYDTLILPIWSGCRPVLCIGSTWNVRGNGRVGSFEDNVPSLWVTHPGDRKGVDTASSRAVSSVFMQVRRAN